MLKGTVTGSVWSTKHVDDMPHGAFLEVELEAGGSLVAFDVLGSGVGERVSLPPDLLRRRALRRPTHRLMP